jgi:asparagine synthase (glutamine-hydrolysing)
MLYSATSVSLLLVSVRIGSDAKGEDLNACTDTGAQPLVSEDGKVTLAVNGEIYNHLSIRASLASSVKFKTHSDCEVILPLVRGSRALFVPLLICVTHQYKKYDKNVPAFLDGMFAFVLLDESVTPSRIIAARDPVGITTLYQGWSSKRPGATYFASELKALADECDKIISFPPGHVYDSQDNSTTRYYQPPWFGDDQENTLAPTTPVDLTLIRESLEEAVRKRLMSEVPYGVLLSGGLDSSLIAAIAARETQKVAQAQLEARQRKLALAASGPPTPKWDDLTERGEESNLSGYILALTDRPNSDACQLAPVALILGRIGKLSRPFSGKESGALSGYHSP